MPTDASLLLSTPRPYKFPVLEAELWLWVKEASQQGKTLTDAVQREQAWRLGGELGYTPEKFKASLGWFEYSKHHHGIRRGQYNGSAARVFLEQCKAAGVHKVPTEFQGAPDAAHAGRPQQGGRGVGRRWSCRMSASASAHCSRRRWHRSYTIHDGSLSP